MDIYNNMLVRLSLVASECTARLALKFAEVACYRSDFMDRSIKERAKDNANALSYFYKPPKDGPNRFELH